MDLSRVGNVTRQTKRNDKSDKIEQDSTRNVFNALSKRFQISVDCRVIG